MTNVAPPILRRELLTFDDLAGHGGVHGQLRWSRAEAREREQQLVLQGIHAEAVVWHLDLEGTTEGLLLVERGLDLQQRRAIPRERHVSRTVDRSDRQARSERRDQALGLRRCQTGGQHLALSRRLSLETAAVIDQRHRIRKTQRAGDIGSSHLADAMTDDGIGIHAPGFPQRREAGLHGEDRRLGDVRLIDAGDVLVCGELVDERPSGQRPEQRVDLEDHVAEDGFLHQESASHRPPLGPHSREYERQLR